MKAICIKEPWAGMILEGKKTIETRLWQTEHRGPLLLCASKTPKSPISGYAFATAELVDCREMTKKDEMAACCKIYPKAFSWVLENIKPIKKFPVKGQLRLFEVKTGKLGTTSKKHNLRSKKWQKKIKKGEKEAGHPICGAKTRSGVPCKHYPMRSSKRCRMHGGKSTGIKTKKGKEKQRKAVTRHGIYAKNFRLSEQEKERLEQIFKDIGKDGLRSCREELKTMIGLLIIQIERGLAYHAGKGKYFDFSRMNDSLIRTFRELKLTPLSGAEVEDMKSRADLFVALRKRLEEKK